MPDDSLTLVPTTTENPERSVDGLDNVVQFTGTTVAPMTPEFVLDAAKDIKLEHVVVLGVTEEGEI